MSNELVLLVVGFALTTVGGGVLGYFLQNRSWSRQHEVTLAHAEREAARAVFEELSALMDRRLYRMRRLEDALADASQPQDEVDRLLLDYRAVLYEWNDSLNRNLARVETYFGTALRTYLERHVYEGFKALHQRLVNMRSERIAGGRPQSVTDELQRLSDRIYDLNAAMGALISGGLVGRHVPPSFTVTESARAARAASS